MKKMSLQWRLTCIITIYIALICGCLTMFVYRNGVYYIDSLQEAVEAQGDNKGDDSEQIYISIPEDKWDDFAKDFSVQVYNNKADYKRNSLIISVLLALLGGGVTYFISGRALKPIGEFSDKIEEVQLQNLSDSQIEENQVKELNRLSVSYNKMLERLSEAFKRVFEPFFRVDKSRSRELGGVGLGLALVNEIVRVHDGSIAIRSNPSGGTIIEVEFAVNRTTT